MKKPKEKFLTSWGPLPFFFPPMIHSRAIWSHSAERKRCKSAFPSHSVWLWTWSCVCWGREARGRHSEARVHTAERCSRKASCRPPAEGKTTGHQTARFGKRTSQGRFQLAQHVVTAVSHRGWEEGLRWWGGGGTAMSLGKEKERKKDKTELKAELHCAYWDCYMSQAKIVAR